MCAATLFARHGKGGYLVYKYLGAGNAANTSSYEITVVHYVNCSETQFELGSVFVGVFAADNRVLYQTLNIGRSSQRYIQKQVFDGCINPKPEVCFFLAFYVTTIQLPNNSAGYILAEQECCRADGMMNITNSGEIGTTNSNKIPGFIEGIDYHTNSSPLMAIKDTAIICHNSPFELDFGTTDPDGDELQYSFCNATAGGTRGDRQPNPPSAPPYDGVGYTPPYSGSLPLGRNVGIDAKTGLIKGTAPDKTGMYTIAVCITEFRKGIAISTTKKEILITVADCTLSAASLLPSYINCDSYSFTFNNESYASNVSSYRWDFGVPVFDASLLTQPTPTFTYSDTGIYHIKLLVTSGDDCTDSASSVVKIYPGFSAGFTVNGSCYQSPFSFNDASYARWGKIIQYQWNFGDDNSISDTSSLKNPSYQYSKTGSRTTTLIVSSDKGCIDTAFKTVAVNDKPQISKPFTDTLICRDDQLQMAVQATGTLFQWSPNYNISDVSLINPVVYPFDTTIYTLVVRDKQCIDSVKFIVNVIDAVSLSMPNEIKLCATDSVVLQPVSNALYYSWQQPGTLATLSSANTKYPKAAPLQNTVYTVTGSVGHCSAQASINLLVSPYPVASVSEDASICFGTTVQLHASTVAAHYAWSPASSLISANTLHPLAGPEKTTAYILAVSDTFYCTKKVYDTIMVKVIPLPLLDAGNDTIAVLGQPLKLSAVSNEEVSFKWSPATGINNSLLQSPEVFISNPSLRFMTYFVTAKNYQGCVAKDSVHIKIFTSKPDIFIPSAFTPDGDGINDIFKPVTAGIAQLYFFRVYSRLGELLYETTKQGEGWNGWYKGKKQMPGTYVYMVAGIDYTGVTISKKGTVVLIR